MLTSQSYDALLNDNLDWLLSAHGDADNYVLGFLPRKGHAEPDAAINRCHTLFCSFDPRPRNRFGEYPPAPQLRRHYDLAYINITRDRLLGTLVNYFESNLPREMGRMEQVGEEREFVCDETEVKARALELAQRFIADHVTERGFLPAPNPYMPEMHGVFVVEAATA